MKFAQAGKHQPTSLPRLVCVSVCLQLKRITSLHKLINHRVNGHLARNNGQYKVITCQVNKKES